jgi:hypothetical protein
MKIVLKVVGFEVIILRGTRVSCHDIGYVTKLYRPPQTKYTIAIFRRQFYRPCNNSGASGYVVW